MTAISKIHTLYPQQPIHIPGFFISFVMAPLAVTALSFFLVIPVFALMLGGPLYLILGFPTLLWRLSRGPITAADTALAAFLVNLAACGLAALLGPFADYPDSHEMITLYAIFGAIFAPLWGATFGWLYNGFTH